MMGYKLTVAVFLACLSSYSYGIQSAIISPASLYLHETFGEFRKNSFLLAVLVSCPLLAAPVGSFSFAKVAELSGRRHALVIINYLFLLLSIIQFIAWHPIVLVASRFALGLAIGGATAIVPIYVSEICGNESRGKYGTCVQLSVTTGIISAFILGFLCSLITAQYRWRLMFGLPGIVAVIPIVFQRYLVEPNGNNGFNMAIGSWKELVSGTNYSNTLLAILINVFQQLSGFNVLVYFSGIIFLSFGFNQQDALLASAVSALPQLFCLILVSFVLDRFGRKPMMMLSSFCLMSTMLTLGFVAKIDDIPKFITLLCIIFARISFSLGLGPIPSLYASEILQDCTRTKGMAIASSLNWISNFAINLSFIPLNNLLEGRFPGQAFIFTIYAILLFFGQLLLVIFMKETKDLDLHRYEPIENVS